MKNVSNDEKGSHSYFWMFDGGCNLDSSVCTAVCCTCLELVVRFTLRGRDLSTTGFAVARDMAKAIAVALVDPGIVPLCSSSVVLTFVESGLSSSVEGSSGNVFKLWDSGCSLEAAIDDCIHLYIFT